MTWFKEKWENLCVKHSVSIYWLSATVIVPGSVVFVANTHVRGPRALRGWLTYAANTKRLPGVVSNRET